MTHTPRNSPSPRTHPPTPEPLEIEWTSDGEAALDVYAWQATEAKRAKSGKSDTIRAVMIYLLMFILGGVLIVSGIVQDDPTSLLSGIFFLVLTMIGVTSLVRRHISPAHVARKAMTRGAAMGLIESTEGRWRCAIGDGRVTFDWVDRGHIVSFPSADITSLVAVSDRIVLLADTFIRGHFPMSALPPGDPEARVWAALRHAPATTEPQS